MVEPGKLYTVSNFRRLKIELAVPLGIWDLKKKQAIHMYCQVVWVIMVLSLPRLWMRAGHRHLLSSTADSSAWETWQKKKPEACTFLLNYGRGTTFCTKKWCLFVMLWFAGWISNSLRIIIKLINQDWTSHIQGHKSLLDLKPLHWGSCASLGTWKWPGSSNSLWSV